MLNNKDLVIALKNRIERLLGEEGLNCLGKYKLFSGTTALQTVPAIQILYELHDRDMERKIVPKSGIEVIIQPTPQSVYKPMTARQRDVCNYFTIVLVQHDPIVLLDSAVSLLFSDPRLNIIDIDNVSAMKKSDGSGYIPPRAILTHLQSYPLAPLY